MNLNKNCAIDILYYILSKSQLYCENMNEKERVSVFAYDSPIASLNDLFSTFSSKYSINEIAITLLILSQTELIDLKIDRKNEETIYEYVTIKYKGYEMILEEIMS